MTKSTWLPDATAPLDGDAPGSVMTDLLTLLADGQLLGSSVSDYEAAADYDGHTALALDAGASLDIAPMLDALTSSSQLFDVPVLDFAGASDDASAT